MTEIMMQAYQVLDEIKEDSKYKEIKYLDKKMLELYPNEISDFQNAKLKYDSVMSEGGSYHPDFKEAVQKFSESKAVLYSKPEVKRYFEVEKEFQDELNDFLFQMTQSVSSHIQTPNKLGIVKKGGSCHVR
ncbi:MAG: YlbF family regulator [Acholeplasmataceae bacterium]|nr:YlbF family regulator [Acholeplasmataceae bacterium]